MEARESGASQRQILHTRYHTAVTNNELALNQYIQLRVFL